MSTDDFVENWLGHYRSVMDGIALVEKLDRALGIIRDVQVRDARVLLVGNGASASIASHYALDFTKQCGIRSMAFNDAAFLTAYGNDYGYSAWVSRAIEHHGREGDAAVLLSTSGQSANIVNGAETCRALGIPVLAFSGFAENNALNSLGDVCFWADSRSYNVVEAVHSMWLGLLCDLLIGAREYAVTE